MKTTDHDHDVLVAAVTVMMGRLMMMMLIMKMIKVFIQGVTPPLSEGSLLRAGRREPWERGWE